MTNGTIVKATMEKATITKEITQKFFVFPVFYTGKNNSVLTTDKGEEFADFDAAKIRAEQLAKENAGKYLVSNGVVKDNPTNIFTDETFYTAQYIEKNYFNKIESERVKNILEETLKNILEETI